MNYSNNSNVSISSDEEGDVNATTTTEQTNQAAEGGIRDRDYECPKTPVPTELELDEPPHEVIGTPTLSASSQSPQSAERKQNFEKEAQKLLAYVKELVQQNDELQAQIEKQHEMINHLDLKVAEERNQLTTQHNKETEALQHEKTLLENKVRKFESQIVRLKTATDMKEVHDIMGLPTRHQSPSTPMRSGVSRLPLYPKTSPSTPLASKTTPPAKTTTPKSASPQVGSVQAANQMVTELRKQLATANAKIKKLQQEGQVWEKLVTHYESMLGVVKVSVAGDDDEETEEQQH